MRPLRASALVAVALTAAACLPLAWAHPPVVPLDEPQPAAFCIVVIHPLDGFRAVRITVDEELSESRKQADFEAADTDGNGVVSVEEADAFQQATTELWKGGLGMGNESLSLEAAGGYRGYTYYREVRPIYGVTWRHLGHGFYEEAVSSHSGEPKDAAASYGSFETQQVREYGFNVADDATSVTLHGADAGRLDGLGTNVTVESHVVEEYVIVQAPDGWRIDVVRGQNYTGPFTRQGPATRIDIAGFDTMAPWEIRFSKGEAATGNPPPPPPPTDPLPPTDTQGLPEASSQRPRTSPAWPAAATLAALAAGAILLGQRGRRGAIP